MAKHKLLNYAFLAGTLSLFTVACQPTPTATKPNQASPVSGSGGGFSKKDWPATGSGYRPTEIHTLNLQVGYSGSTRNPGGHNITMSTGLVAGEPTYNLILSGYKLDATGRQYATRGLFHFAGNAINGYDASGGVSKYIGMAMVGNLESTDGVHFRFATTSGHMNGYYTTPEVDQHGNLNGSCQYYEHTEVPIKLDPNSLLTLDEANKTFSLHVPFSGLPGTVSRGLSPWQCAYNCSPGGAYNEQCDDQISATGSLDMSGTLLYTAPAELQLIADPEIFSTAPEVRGGTGFHFSQHDWAPDQLWRFTMPPYKGQPFIVEGVVPYLEYPHPLDDTVYWDWKESGWRGQKGWTSYSEDGATWEDYDYYQDGTYHFELISDRHQRATTTVRIDSTKPDFSEPDLKILPDGRRQISVTVKDPIVNGVRAGLDAGMFSQMLLWTDGGAWGNVQAKQVDDNTVRVVGEYMPNPLPTPTPQPTVYPSWSPSASSSPTYDASGNPNPGYSGNPGPTPHPTPTPWQDPDELLDDSTQIYFEFLAKDKVHNPRNFAIELNPSNLKLLLNERYFSPNDDGRKDTVAFRVEDAAPTEDWVLQVKSGGAVVKEFTGHGSQNLLWDGKNSSGQSQAEGKYNLVLTSKKQGGWRKSQSVRSVWIDITPPQITSFYQSIANGRKEMNVSFSDALSGLDNSSLKVNFSTNVVSSNQISLNAGAKRTTARYGILLKQNSFAHQAGFSVASVGMPQNGIETAVSEIRDQAGNAAQSYLMYLCEQALFFKTQIDNIASQARAITQEINTKLPKFEDFGLLNAPDLSGGEFLDAEAAIEEGKDAHSSNASRIDSYKRVAEEHLQGREIQVQNLENEISQVNVDPNRSPEEKASRISHLLGLIASHHPVIQAHKLFIQAAQLYIQSLQGWLNQLIGLEHQLNAIKKAAKDSGCFDSGNGYPMADPIPCPDTFKGESWVDLTNRLKSEVRSLVDEYRKEPNNKGRVTDNKTISIGEMSVLNPAKKPYYALSGDVELNYTNRANKNRKPVYGPPNDNPKRDWRFPLRDELSGAVSSGMIALPSYRDYDAEKKIMELIAFENDARFRSDGKMRSDAVFDLVIYAERVGQGGDLREVCFDCRRLIPLFKYVFPNANIVFTDQAGNCF